MAGIVINLPWAKGDKFYVEGSFTEGAGAYVGLDGGISGKNNNWSRFNGANVAPAWAMDSVFGNAGLDQTVRRRQQLDPLLLDRARRSSTTGPRLCAPSLWGSYTAADYNANATTIFCSSPQSPVRTYCVLRTPRSRAGGRCSGCNPDFNVWAIGIRTIWNPVPKLDIGLEIVYAKVEPKTTRL